MTYINVDETNTSSNKRIINLSDRLIYTRLNTYTHTYVHMQS